jgi:Spy/CpxP family protein refolding chaperone
MKAKLLFLTLSIIMASASFAGAQVNVDVKPGAQQQKAGLVSEENENDIVRNIFSPITEQLNLTAGQKFRIANIATATMLQADALFLQLDELDDQLSVAAFTGRLDDSQIRQLADKQAALLSQIISMKARAKMSFYRVLNAEQRAVVADQFRARNSEGNLGSISN